jgi:hypothetical protein
MNLNYINIAILILIVLVSCSIIVYQLRSNIERDEIINYNKNLLSLIKNDNQENFVSSLSDKYNIEELLGITKIDIVGDNTDRKVVIEGTKLDKINNVFFDNVDVSFDKLEENIKFKPPDDKNLVVSDNELELKLLISIKKDFSIIYPTGLFYRPGLTDKWNLYLKEKDKDNKLKVTDEIIKYYDAAIDSIKPALPLSFKVTNLKITIDDITREVKVTWEAPNKLLQESNLDNFSYIFYFNPVGEDPNDNERRTDILNILDDEAILRGETIMRTEHRFNKDRLIPGNSYKYYMRTVKKKDGSYETLDQTSDKEIFTFNQNKDNYHTHLYDSATGKFKLEEIDVAELSEKNPELVQTYYQMLAYNKSKASGEITTAQTNITNNVGCIKGNIDQLYNNQLDSSFQNNINKLIKENTFKEDQEFVKNQTNQEEQLDRIEEKLAEVEKYNGKKTRLSDLNIKTLKSIKENSLVRLEELNGEKRLVLLNEGCLAYDKSNRFGKKDDYGILPCNSFDTEQQFVLNKINNLDEYNYLLATNIQDNLTDEENKNVNYPFYVLQPDNSNKCVSINNKQIQIVPCNGEEEVRFEGYFDSNKCDI